MHRTNPNQSRRPPLRGHLPSPLKSEPLPSAPSENLGKLESGSWAESFGWDMRAGVLTQIGRCPNNWKGPGNTENCLKILRSKKGEFEKILLRATSGKIKTVSRFYPRSSDTL